MFLSSILDAAAVDEAQVQSFFSKLTLEKLLYAAVLLVLCAVLIKLILKATDRMLGRSRLDKAVHPFIRTIVKLVLLFTAIMLIAGTLGVDTSSLLALLSVAGCMTLGSVAAAMGACALPRLPAGAAVAFRCALEVTGGVHALAETALPLRVPLICAAVSFGGLSILLQNAAYWRACGVSLGRLALLRLLHAAIAFCLCLLTERLPL